jgi:ubiquinone/menaquinone biosynthesis C-methylase UbiE
MAGVLDQAFHITGIDISEEILEVARQNIKKAGLSQKIELKACSASALSFSDQSFDLSVSNASLHHRIKPLAAFNEIKRITKTGGFCLIRDNMRLSPVYYPLIDLISFVKGMNKKQHDLWVQAIQAGYTVSELKALLEQSDLKNYKISVNPTFLDLIIKCSF